jgi:hypothetical protein
MRTKNSDKTVDSRGGDGTSPTRIEVTDIDKAKASSLSGDGTPKGRVIPPPPPPS